MKIAHLVLPILIIGPFTHLAAMGFATKKSTIEREKGAQVVHLLPTSLRGTKLEMLDLSGKDLSFDLAYKQETEEGTYAHPLSVLCDLQGLQTLQLDNCQLEDLPDEIKNLKELRVLSLNFNKLSLLNPWIIGLELHKLSVLFMGEGDLSQQSEALTVYNLIGGGLFSHRARTLYTCLQTLPKEAAQELEDPLHTDLINALLACKAFDTMHVAKAYTQIDLTDVPEKLSVYDELHEKVGELNREVRRFQAVLFTEIRRDLQRLAAENGDQREHPPRLIDDSLRIYAQHPEDTWSADTKKAYAEACVYSELVQVLDDIYWHISYIFWIGGLIDKKRLLYGNAFTLCPEAPLPKELLVEIVKLVSNGIPFPSRSIGNTPTKDGPSNF